jgi:Phage integrase family.
LDPSENSFWVTTVPAEQTADLYGNPETPLNPDRSDARNPVVQPSQLFNQTDYSRQFVPTSMRLEATKDGHKVWLTDDDLEELRRSCVSLRDGLIIQLGGHVGLRAVEIPQVTPNHVRRSESEHYRLRVPEAKDTSSSGGKPRDAYLPESVERDLFQFQRRDGLDADQPFVDLSPRGVRAAVTRVAETTADRTGNDDFRHVSSHDLRRRFAQRLLVDESMNPRVVMAVGGWSSFEAIQPYLNTPTESVVNEAFEAIQ